MKECKLCNDNRVISIIEPMSQPPKRITSPCECADIRKFIDLPLGTRFQYQNGKQQWIIISHYNGWLECGLIASWQGIDGPISGQSICSATETPEELKELEVIVIC